METLTLIFSVLVLACGAFWMASLRRRPVLDIAAAVKQYRGFVAQEILVAPDNVAALAVDERETQLAFAWRVGDQAKVRLFSVRDLLAVAVFDAGATVSRIVRLSREGEVLIRALGPTVITAVLTPPTGVAKVRRGRGVELRLVVSDPASPIVVIPLTRGTGNPDSAARREALARAEHWFARASLIIHRTDERDELVDRDLPVPPRFDGARQAGGSY